MEAKMDALLDGKQDVHQEPALPGTSTPCSQGGDYRSASNGRNPEAWTYKALKSVLSNLFEGRQEATAIAEALHEYNALTNYAHAAKLAKKLCKKFGLVKDMADPPVSLSAFLRLLTCSCKPPKPISSRSYIDILSESAAGIVCSISPGSAFSLHLRSAFTFVIIFRWTASTARQVLLHWCAPASNEEWDVYLANGKLWFGICRGRKHFTYVITESMPTRRADKWNCLALINDPGSGTKGSSLSFFFNDIRPCRLWLPEVCGSASPQRLALFPGTAAHLLLAVAFSTVADAAKVVDLCAGMGDVLEFNAFDSVSDALNAPDRRMSALLRIDHASLGSGTRNGRVRRAELGTGLVVEAESVELVLQSERHFDRQLLGLNIYEALLALFIYAREVDEVTELLKSVAALAARPFLFETVIHIEKRKLFVPLLSAVMSVSSLLSPAGILHLVGVLRNLKPLTATNFLTSVLLSPILLRQLTPTVQCALFAPLIEALKEHGHLAHSVDYRQLFAVCLHLMAEGATETLLHFARFVATSVSILLPDELNPQTLLRCFHLLEAECKGHCELFALLSTLISQRVVGEEWKDAICCALYKLVDSGHEPLLVERAMRLSLELNPGSAESLRAIWQKVRSQRAEGDAPIISERFAIYCAKLLGRGKKDWTAAVTDWVPASAESCALFFTLLPSFPESVMEVVLNTITSLIQQKCFSLPAKDILPSLIALCKVLHSAKQPAQLSICLQATSLFLVRSLKSGCIDDLLYVLECTIDFDIALLSRLVSKLLKIIKGEGATPLLQGNWPIVARKCNFLIAQLPKEGNYEVLARGAHLLRLAAHLSDWAALPSPAVGDSGCLELARLAKRVIENITGGGCAEEGVIVLEAISHAVDAPLALLDRSTGEHDAQLETAFKFLLLTSLCHFPAEQCFSFLTPGICARRQSKRVNAFLSRVCGGQACLDSLDAFAALQSRLADTRVEQDGSVGEEGLSCTRVEVRAASEAAGELFQRIQRELDNESELASREAAAVKVQHIIRVQKANNALHTLVKRAHEDGGCFARCTTTPELPYNFCGDVFDPASSFRFKHALASTRELATPFVKKQPQRWWKRPALTGNLISSELGAHYFSQRQLLAARCLLVRRMHLVSLLVAIDGPNNRLDALWLGDAGHSTEHFALCPLKPKAHRRVQRRIAFADISTVREYKFINERRALIIVLRSREEVILAFATREEMLAFAQRLTAASNVPTRKGQRQLKEERWLARWQSGAISNFEYLMRLNCLASRSRWDFSQYPVFPFVHFFSDGAPRDLSRPMGMLGGEARTAAFRARLGEVLPYPDCPPYLYGSHYSSPAIAFHFLFRLRPYHRGAKAIQGGTFDMPDRLFASAAALERNARSELSDVRELIPEMYSLPALYANLNHFDLGVTQRKARVHNVALPCADPFRFVWAMRHALESPAVSLALGHWIDLVFGCKQRGLAAARADNLFFHLTYESAAAFVAGKDAEERKAAETQMYHFGQTPLRLFPHTHPQRQCSEGAALAGAVALRRFAIEGPLKGEAVAVKASPPGVRGHQDVIVLGRAAIALYTFIPLFGAATSGAPFELVHVSSTGFGKSSEAARLWPAHGCVELVADRRVALGGFPNGQILLANRDDLAVVAVAHFHDCCVEMMHAGEQGWLLSGDRAGVVFLSRFSPQKEILQIERGFHASFGRRLSALAFCPSEPDFFIIVTRRSFAVRSVFAADRPLFSVAAGKRERFVAGALAFGHVPCAVLLAEQREGLVLCCYSLEGLLVSVRPLPSAPRSTGARLLCLGDRQWDQSLFVLLAPGQLLTFSLPFLEPRLEQLLPEPTLGALPLADGRALLLWGAHGPHSVLTA